MSPLMQQLHDIEGLDAVSPWPLAFGWWILIALGALLLVAGFWGLIRRIKYLRSWRRETNRRLDQLERGLSPETSREALASLSEYLRRIAMHRFPRKECAGLVGADWLEWLQSHDPKQFEWVTKGSVLIDMPYAPAHAEPPLEQVQELIHAVRPWVR